MGYSETLPVFGSILPRNCSAKWVNQIMPCSSSTTSCGWICRRGRAYSVTMKRLERPVSRGSVLQRVGPGLLAQIDRGEILRDAFAAAALAERALRVADQPLRMLRRAARVVADHPVEDVDELLGVVLRAHDAVEVVAAHAVEQRLLFAGRCRGSSRTIRRSTSAWAGSCVGASLISTLAVLSGGDVGARRAFEVVADRADAERVLAGLEPAGREAEAALVVGRDADGDGRAAFLALTTTPSITPSLADDTVPAKARPDGWLCACDRATASKTSASACRDQRTALCATWTVLLRIRQRTGFDCSVQRLELDDRGAVVGADPERHRASSYCRRTRDGCW